MNFSTEESKENDLIIKAATGNIKTRTIRNLFFSLTPRAVRFNNRGAPLLGLAKSIYYQDLVSWIGGMKGMSPGTAAPCLPQSLARLASRAKFFCFLAHIPFRSITPTAERGPRLSKMVALPYFANSCSKPTWRVSVKYIKM